jgi:hypothetical protein
MNFYGRKLFAFIWKGLHFLSAFRFLLHAFFFLLSVCLLLSCVCLLLSSVCLLLSTSRFEAHFLAIRRAICLFVCVSLMCRSDLEICLFFLIYRFM